MTLPRYHGVNSDTRNSYDLMAVRSLRTLMNVAHFVAINLCKSRVQLIRCGQRKCTMPWSSWCLSQRRFA